MENKKDIDELISALAKYLTKTLTDPKYWPDKQDIAEKTTALAALIRARAEMCDYFS